MFHALFYCPPFPNMATKVHIREQSWMARLAAGKLGAKRVAIVWRHTIHLHGATKAEFLANKRWVLHELQHVAQYDKLGTAAFITRYLWQSFKNGYRDNDLEQEARASEADESLLE